MTAQTPAQRNASYRTRKAQRIAQMEAALREIVSINPANLQENDNMALIHAFLKARSIALEALNPPALHIEV